MFSDMIRKWLLLTFLVVTLINVRFWLEQHLMQGRNPVPEPIHTSPAHSVHADNGYEEAWTQYVENGLVQIQVISAKTTFVFRPMAGNINHFHQGSIAAVTIQCDKGFNKDCDLAKPFKLYSNNVLVEVVKVKI